MSANSTKATARWLQPKNLGKAGLITAWVVASFFLGVALLLALDAMLELVGLSFDNLDDAVATTVKAGLMYAFATTVALGVPWVVYRAKPNLRQLGMDRSLEWSDIGLGLSAYVPYFIVSLIVISLVAWLFPGFNIAEAQETGFRAIADRTGYIMAFVTLVMLAPLAEEVLFRGYLYGKLRNYIGLIGAIVLSSSCFAAIHLQWNVAVDVFALSLVLCGLREFTGSIWAGVVLHMTKNAVAYYFLFISPITM